jgi:radical SAM-linked protein
MRIRITFSKTIEMRYTSHLDLHRTWERTFRRAELPLSYSLGFKPKPKINLAAALPLGFTSDCEIIEIWLDKNLDPKYIKKQLDEAIPPGILVHAVAEIDANRPKIPNQILSAIYEVTLVDPIPQIEKLIDQITKKESILRERRGKHYDLRPLIESIRVIQKNGCQYLEMQLAARTGATGRPDEVLDALGIDPFSTKIHRKELILTS